MVLWYKGSHHTRPTGPPPTAPPRRAASTTTWHATTPNRATPCPTAQHTTAEHPQDHTPHTPHSTDHTPRTPHNTTAHTTQAVRCCAACVGLCCVGLWAFGVWGLGMWCAPMCPTLHVSHAKKKKSNKRKFKIWGPAINICKIWKMKGITLPRLNGLGQGEDRGRRKEGCVWQAMGVWGCQYHGLCVCVCVFAYVFLGRSH